MILVLNLNPSLDKIYTVNKLIYGGVVRTFNVNNTAGGKGIHVANVCKILREDCIVTGFIGGHTGQFITDTLNKKQIIHDFIHVQGETRTCINIATSDGKQTEILEPGPTISEKEIDLFLKKYQKLIKRADIIVASGSLPNNIPYNFYGKLAEIANTSNKKFLLDTSGQTLKKSLSYKPYFIKPNKDELETLSGKKIANINDAFLEIEKFCQLGIKMPIISLGKEGAIVGYKNNIYHAIPPKYKAVNAVGSGDAFVAGITIGLKNHYPITDIIKLGSACGTANVLEEESGYVSLENVKKIFNLVKIEQIS